MLPRTIKKSLAVALLSLFAVGVLMESQAEARRYRRTVVYRSPAVARTVVRAPYVSVGVGRGYYGPRVRVSVPRAGVYIGF